MPERDHRAKATSFHEPNVGAFSRGGDSNLGEFDDAVILNTFGEASEVFGAPHGARHGARAS
jgi:hypothetical protein